MPVATLQPPTANSEPPRKRFTRSEVDQMLEAGLFAGQRLELIDGDLIDKIGQNPPHAIGIRRLMAWLIGILGADHVLVQVPMEAAIAERERSLPEPDLAVLAAEDPDYNRRHPAGDELLLVIEVADTTVRYDATVKRDLYARAGVPEYWVLDIPGRRLFVHRKPDQGKYADVIILSEADSAALESNPAHTIAIQTLLP